MRQLLTQVFNLFLIKIGYFKENNVTLKRILFLATLLFAGSNISAQGNIEFIENKGQWDSRVRYKGDVSNGNFFIRNGGFTVVQHNPADVAAMARFTHGLSANGNTLARDENLLVRSHAWNVDFIGATNSMKIVPEKPIHTYNNYFLGNNPSKWAAECRIFQAITMENVYPNVDVRYYTDRGTLKYDILIKPGGDVSKIALKYEGVNKLQIKNKELLISTSLADFKESAPYTFQAGMTGRKEVPCKYIVTGNILKFDVKDYDRSSTLVIDPTIIFCSFSGSHSDNWGFTATYGPDESFFGGGIVFGGTGGGFPVSPGAYETTYQGGEFDISIMKLTPDGSNRVYATYIGGNGKDQPHSLIVDPQGQLVLAGRTNSSDYPVLNNGAVAGSDFDIVVTKLNASGTNIIGSRKIGGSGKDGVNIDDVRHLVSLQRNYGDDGRSEVILDAAGNVYVASSTQSSNFPGTTGFFQPAFGGGTQDGVVLKFSPDLSNLLFASYLGGSGNDAAYVLSIHPATGNVYVAGGTESANLLPGTQAGTIGPSNHLNSGNPTIDGYVAVINPAGTTVIRSTYIGTNGIDQIFGIQFDANSFPYIMGQTTGSWPIQNAVYNNTAGKQFIAKLQPDLSAYVYSTAFGSSSAVTPNISPIAFLVDRCENVYISGWGGFFSTDNSFNSAGTTGLPVTSDAFKSTTDGKDLYFFVLKKDAASHLFGSFFGENNQPGTGCDHVDGGTSRFDRNGKIYQAICGNCNINGRPSYPTTTGAWSTSNPATDGGQCNLTMLKVNMDLSGVTGGVQSAIDGNIRDTAGCVPQTVDFTDTIGNAQSYEWYFDYVPGNPPTLTTTTPTAQWTFNTVGIHSVMLVAIDPSTCNQRDSSFMNIKIGITKATPAFIYARQDPCEDFKYLFTNTTIEPALHPFKDTSFVWDFGDGSPLVKTGDGPVTHQYAGPGTYFVKLLLNDSTYCNSPDDTTLRIDVSLNVKAGIEAITPACVGDAVQFTNTSTGAATYLWNFGDGATSTDENPTHTYGSAQTYTVTLTAFNPGSCNRQDIATFSIVVFDVPIALAAFSPDPPIVNTPTTFTNSSLNAVRYKWLFGDGDSLEVSSLQSVIHQYNATGTFQAKLVAYNQAGCTDTFPMTVSSLVLPAVDVPNAFTPQSGDVNSIVMVKGFGIAKMQFAIWNRWGQKVFETTDRNKGWDGKVKGALQPMDVYAYTLTVEFFDGTKITKKGDITLIR